VEEEFEKTLGCQGAGMSAMMENVGVYADQWIGRSVLPLMTHLGHYRIAAVRALLRTA
jgi:hypothetical protein